MTSSKPARVERINVAVAPETVKALELIIEMEGVTLTEALRRLSVYGEFFYRLMKREGASS